jgi:hypothetical protein
MGSAGRPQSDTGTTLGRSRSAKEATITGDHHHRDVFVSGRDRLVVTHQASGLDDRRDTGDGRKCQTTDSPVAGVS